MKTFAKRVAITTGILLTALVCMGIVYIDSVQNYWRVGGTGSGFVQLLVSNKLVLSISTNTGRIGINVSNANTFSVEMVGIKPATNATGNGTSAAGSGALSFTGSDGGGTFATTTATGGAGGGVLLNGGNGGDAPLATTNQTGGVGGNFVMTAGGGGGAGGVATNATTGGNGGAATFSSGTGASPSGTASTNTVGGNGGALSFNAGAGGTPAVGWARKSGNGGIIQFSGASSGNSERTNSGDGSTVTFLAGNSGNVSTAPGNPGNPGNINLTAGNGGTGGSNANGGRVYLLGGSGAVAGDVVIGRNLAGTVRGGLMVGPLLGGSASITNILGASALLDFGSVAAGTVEDLLITVTGVTSNNVAVSLSVPWQSASGGGSFTTFNSNDVVYVRFVNNNLVTAIDPNPGVFTVVGFRIR